MKTNDVLTQNYDDPDYFDEKANYDIDSEDDEIHNHEISQCLDSPYYTKSVHDTMMDVIRES